ncbi:putative DENN domain-containing protein 2 [Monocercomonoides exilis]|uniref:putative DENN domain-containing protein 2 n=1 Tax=Monocercomonoides exilis TaxID=2049356 RepID=UPI003559BA3A|nr:putative DENN domain-containing protein 2 [Monocercomonoides exilis]|eukprot:MONOS_3575.1-p1 / transcript=MONOS_3575.1 / gene=MONOS_3575 / organism=Monocercomonoides_exilis_PA203 / gene_product=unspecified product / transcript_product=unspecified product / location=Mono_scaffold00085:64845-68848(-) / protein_length=1314 / sequence_SO=supercontig / SO=protein_coding / is_pseudo=false
MKQLLLEALLHISFKLDDATKNAMENDILIIEGDKRQRAESFPNSLDSKLYHPEILFEFDCAPWPAPKNIANFCFPEKNFLFHSLSIRQGTFVFCLTTQSNERRFGFCLRFQVDDSKPPECICILTSNYWVKSMENMLCSFQALYLNSDLIIQKELPTASQLNVVYRPLLDVLTAFKFPRQGSNCLIKIPDSSHFILISRPSSPLGFLENLNTSILFSKFSCADIASIHLWLLLERSVLIVGDNLQQIGEACHALECLLVPFVWHHAIIMIVPYSLIECTEAPMPFIMGTLRENLKGHEGGLSGTTAVANLEDGTVLFPIDSALNRLKRVQGPREAAKYRQGANSERRTSYQSSSIFQNKLSNDKRIIKNGNNKVDKEGKGKLTSAQIEYLELSSLSFPSTAFAPSPPPEVASLNIASFKVMLFMLNRISPNFSYSAQNSASTSNSVLSPGFATPKEKERLMLLQSIRASAYYFFRFHATLCAPIQQSSLPTAVLQTDSNKEQQLPQLQPHSPSSFGAAQFIDVEKYVCSFPRSTQPFVRQFLSTRLFLEFAEFHLQEQVKAKTKKKSKTKELNVLSGTIKRRISAPQKPSLSACSADAANTAEPQQEMQKSRVLSTANRDAYPSVSMPSPNIAADSSSSSSQEQSLPTTSSKTSSLHCHLTAFDLFAEEINSVVDGRLSASEAFFLQPEKANQNKALFLQPQQQVQTQRQINSSSQQRSVAAPSKPTISLICPSPPKHPPPQRPLLNVKANAPSLSVDSRLKQPIQKPPLPSHPPPLTPPVSPSAASPPALPFSLPSSAPPPPPSPPPFKAGLANSAVSVSASAPFVVRSSPSSNAPPFHPPASSEPLHTRTSSAPKNMPLPPSLLPAHSLSQLFPPPPPPRHPPPTGASKLITEHSEQAHESTSQFPSSLPSTEISAVSNEKPMAELNSIEKFEQIPSVDVKKQIRTEMVKSSDVSSNSSSLSLSSSSSSSSTTPSYPKSLSSQSGNKPVKKLSLRQQAPISLLPQQSNRQSSISLSQNDSSSQAVVNAQAPSLQKQASQLSSDQRNNKVSQRFSQIIELDKIKDKEEEESDVDFVESDELTDLSFFEEELDEETDETGGSCEVLGEEDEDKDHSSMKLQAKEQERKQNSPVESCTEGNFEKSLKESKRFHSKCKPISLGETFRVERHLLMKTLKRTQMKNVLPVHREESGRNDQASDLFLAQENDLNENVPQQQELTSEEDKEFASNEDVEKEFGNCVIVDEDGGEEDMFDLSDDYLSESDSVEDEFMKITKCGGFDKNEDDAPKGNGYDENGLLPLLSRTLKRSIFKKGG